ncbi:MULTISPECIES: HAD family hydrolase [Mycobacterium]|jgi:beta-phosphoglucomutase-like phosphatase (HAD superfamily)|uniref:Haloacid dehalogenase n=1 Tax=Mycobacterium gordonae TaxID=1778 RepID=A0A1A6BEE6_MYCGO|nr:MULTISPECIES: HAD family phosphatase [Mycobacterium]MBI2699799.1 HAD family phosphatase [Mycobacterium sp.]MCQ4361144.1 HAD family phosphatase [Mycobacterium gordonae]MCV7007817.1 HAD family phosphatase [Mycobacterium gordonae]OBS00604.1 haloacid dehalogenase [Mycobacterium gordonae]ODR23837.1 haloacid dehalogenase [Mycobacterium gordonae]
MTQERLTVFRHFEPARISTLLCDADGNLFPSEEPAFEASVEVTNRFLARFGVAARYTADELRKATTGKNFRSTATDLAVQAGVPVDEELARGRPHARIASGEDVATGRALSAFELEQWVQQERDHVTAHLSVTLNPDDRVRGPLNFLACRYDLAAVSSSAAVRLNACFTATGLDSLIPAAVRFSAEDSLPVPTSKPDPAVYLLSGEVLGVAPARGLAIEDSVPGVLSAVAAGFVTVGNLMFVAPDERAARSRELVEAGASAITDSWSALADFLPYVGSSGLLPAHQEAVG